MPNINLTFTQCKTLINNGFNLRDIVEEWDNQPEFLEFMRLIESVQELAAIIQGGCVSGAYMPAVTYHTALECMTKHYDSIEEQINSIYGDELAFTFNPANEHFAGFCAKLCACAVESWVGSYADLVECLEDNGCL